VRKVQLDNGVKCWAFSSSQCVQAAVKNVEEYLCKRDDVNWKLPTKAETPLQTAYRPELDVSPELEPTDTAYYMSLIGMLRQVRPTGGQRDNSSSSPSRETTSDIFRPSRSPQPTGKVHSTLHEEANRHFHETICQCRSCTKQHDRTIATGVRSKPEDPRARPHGHLGI